MKINSKLLKCAVLTLFILLIISENGINAEPITTLAVLTITKKVIMIVALLWTVVDKTELSNHIDIPFMKNKDEQIFKGMEEITSHVQNLEVMIIETTQAINDLKGFISRNSKFEQLEDMVTTINYFYKTYENYVKIHDDLERDTLENFANNVVQDSAISVKGYLQRIYGIVFDRGLLKMLSDDLKDNIGSCSNQRSHQQVLYQLYNTILLMELKGHILMEFSYMVLKTHGRGNFTTESEIYRKDFEERTEKTLISLKQALKNSDRTLWRCDPKHHVEGKTFLQLTQLLQGVAEHEVNLNSDGSCVENCEYYEHAESSLHKYNCDGKYYSCRYVEPHMNICPASKNSSRRYEFIAYENGPSLGKKKDDCNQGFKRLESWHYWFWHCSTCLCICDQQGKKSDRYFNMREAVSDVHNNKIVTGVRFTKKNRLIHLQVQEGQLMEQGQINRTTTRWVPVSDYTILDKGIRNGKDYHTMSYEKRHFDLDDLIAPLKHIVTGVRFRMIGQHLNMEMRVSEINYETGQIVEPDTSFWIGNDHTSARFDANKRTEIGLYLPDVPAKSYKPSIPLSSTNSYIKFTFSDMYKDASQTTVPFLDAQDVVNEPPVPLEGIGLFLKGQRGYGGFIAPKIITYDYSAYV